MSISKNDIYLLSKLAEDSEKIPDMTSVELSEKYYTSRAGLYKLLNKRNYNSYNDFQFSIRFKEECRVQGISFEACESNTLFSKTSFNSYVDAKRIMYLENENFEEKYFKLYDIFCDLEEMEESELSTILYEELLEILHDSIKVFEVEDKVLRLDLFNSLISQNSIY